MPDNNTSFDKMFRDPEWGQSFDFFGSERWLSPGAYPMPGTGGNAPVAQLLSALQPMLGALAKLADLDQRIVQALGGSGVFGTRGSFLNYTNPANILFNQQEAVMARSDFTKFRGVEQAGRQDMLTNVYQRLGETPQNARQRAAAALENPFSPMGIVANELFGTYQMREMQRGFSAARMTGGVMSASGQELESRRALFSQTTAAIAARYVEDPFSFGMMKGGDVGQLTAVMASRGMIDFRDRGGATPANVARMTNKVQSMATALLPLQEFFNEDIPQLMERLDKTFGVSASTFSPAEIQNRLLRMKHTARQTGVSMEALMGMSSSAQQMLGTLGMTGMGSDVIATQAAGMMGSGVNLARLDPEKWRQGVLRDVTGQQASRAAMNLSGAYLIAQRSGFKGDVEEFRRRIGEDTTAAGLSAALGRMGFQTTAADIVRAGASEAGEDIRTKTGLSATLMDDRHRQFRRTASGILSSQARASTGERQRAYQLLARKMADPKWAGAPEDIQALLKDFNLTPSDMSAIEGVVRSTKDTAAGLAGFEGGGRGAEASYQAYKRSKQIEARTADLAVKEAEILKNTESRWGILGLVTGSGPKIGDWVKDAFGIPQAKINKKAFENIAKTGAGGMVNDALRMAYLGVDATGMALDEKEVENFKKIAFGEGATEKSISEAAQKLWQTSTEGKAATKASEMAGGGGEGKEAWMKKYTAAAAPERARMMKGAAMEKALEETLDGATGADAVKKLEKAMGQKDFSFDKFLTEKEGLGLKGDQLEKVRESWKKKGEEVGLKLSDEPGDILRKILDILEGLKGPLADMASKAK